VTTPVVARRECRYVDEDARRDLQRSGNRRPGLDRQPDLMFGDSARNARSASRCRARSSSSRCPRSATRLCSSAAVRVSALASVLALDHQMPPLTAMLRTEPQPDQFALWATPRSISCFSRVSPVQRASTNRWAILTAQRCSGDGRLTWRSRSGQSPDSSRTTSSRRQTAVTASVSSRTHRNRQTIPTGEPGPAPRPSRDAPRSMQPSALCSPAVAVLVVAKPP